MRRRARLRSGDGASVAGRAISTLPLPIFNLLSLLHGPYSDVTDPNHRFFGTHYCGPGGGGDTTSGLDQLCAAHDACYKRDGVSWVSNFNPFTSGAAMGGCDRLLCTELRNLQPPSAQEAQGKTRVYLTFGCDYIQ
jgi:hypothetical protein